MVKHSTDLYVKRIYDTFLCLTSRSVQIHVLRVMAVNKDQGSYAFTVLGKTRNLFNQAMSVVLCVQKHSRCGIIDQSNIYCLSCGLHDQPEQLPLP